MNVLNNLERYTAKFNRIGKLTVNLKKNRYFKCFLRCHTHIRSKGTKMYVG